MEVHEAAGNPAEALRAFDELRQRLRDELATAPGPAVMAVHERLLRGDGPPPEAPPPAIARARPAARRRSRRPPRSTRSSGAREALAALRGALGRGGRRRAPARPAGRRAGIGKTRLAAEFARAAHADGAVVLYGRFDEDGARRLPAGSSRCCAAGPAAPRSTVPAQRLGPRAADLAALLPELGRRRPPGRPPADAGAER